MVSSFFFVDLHTIGW